MPFKIRPYHPSDTGELAALFYETVHTVNTAAVGSGVIHCLSLMLLDRFVPPDKQSLTVAHGLYLKPGICGKSVEFILEIRYAFFPAVYMGQDRKRQEPDSGDVFIAVGEIGIERCHNTEVGSKHHGTGAAADDQCPAVGADLVEDACRAGSCQVVHEVERVTADDVDDVVVKKVGSVLKLDVEEIYLFQTQSKETVTSGDGVFAFCLVFT